MIRIYRYFIEVSEGGQPWLTTIRSGEHRVEGKWSDYQAHTIARTELEEAVRTWPEFQPDGIYATVEPVVNVRLVEEIP